MNCTKNILLLIGILFSQLLCLAQSPDAELMLQKTDIEVINNKMTQNHYYELKINNRAGEEYTKITIPFSDLYKVSKLDAYIKDWKGKIVKKLKKSEIITRSSISDFSFYEDDFVQEFRLKYNSYPYTIVYSYQVQQSEFLHIDYWMPVIARDVPTRSAELNLSVPSNYKIAFKNHHIDDCSIDTLGNTVTYHWKTSYTDELKYEVCAPPVSALLPSVAVVPKKFQFEEKGSQQDWVSYGNWESDLIEGLNELPDSEKSIINNLIKDATTDKEKIRILYHYLQDATRYINVTIETGGLKPYPASYVAQNKYGDCKALTNYFKSVLDYVQIPSYYTNVWAGNPIKRIDKDFPSQQFNHIILYVPQQDKDIWLDCTSDGAFNYLGTFSQNREAFIIDGDNSRFEKTPSLQPKDVLVCRNMKIGYSHKEATVKSQNTYKGDDYEEISHLSRNYSTSEKDRIVRNYLIPDGFQLANYQVSNLNRDSLAIGLNYEATSQNMYKHYGNDILISNIAFSLPDFEKPEKRKLDVQIDYPTYEIDTLIYDIPAGYKRNKSQDSYTVSGKYGEYKFQIFEQDNNIMVVKSLLINPGCYPVSEYKEFYNFYQQVAGIENRTHLSFYK